MALRVEHELHHRRRGRNTGLGLVLVAFVGLVFALTVVKVLNLENIVQFERTDHVARPALIPEETPVDEAGDVAAPAEGASE